MPLRRPHVKKLLDRGDFGELSRLLHDKSPNVRRHVVVALSSTDTLWGFGQEALPAELVSDLIACLQDPNESMRFFAASALSKAGSPLAANAVPAEIDQFVDR